MQKKTMWIILGISGAAFVYWLYRRGAFSKKLVTSSFTSTLVPAPEHTAQGYSETPIPPVGNEPTYTLLPPEKIPSYVPPIHSNIEYVPKEGVTCEFGYDEVLRIAGLSQYINGTLVIPRQRICRRTGA